MKTGSVDAQMLDFFSSIRKAPWQTETLQKGLHWKYRHFDLLFDAPQSINILEVDLQNSGLELQLVASDTGRVPTSKLAEANGAIAAINGTFFNMKLGHAVCFIQSDGNMHNPSAPDTGPFTEEGAIALNAEGKASLLWRPAKGWSQMSAFEEVMAAGPMLLAEGNIIPQLAVSFNLSRHPRTGIGILPNGNLLLVTADGRQAQAAGLSSLEFAQLFQAMGCEYALNLDGGGSTCMWISGEGVVSFPSDNKIFDHQGERSVSNVVILRPKK